MVTQYYAILYVKPGVTGDMEYDERLARFRQGHVNPFDRSESDGTSDRKDPLKQGESAGL